MSPQIHQINLSNGGVPKLSVESAVVTDQGLAGDRHNDTVHHGGPERALCIYSLELIEALRAEGHPIVPGSIGENVTTQGIDLSLVEPGARLQLGADVIIEVTSYTTPCRIIGASFLAENFQRVSQKLNPGWSRLYARVLNPGIIRINDAITVHSISG